MSRPGDKIGSRPDFAAGEKPDSPGGGSSDIETRGQSDRLTRLILIGLTVVLAAGQAAYVVRYGRNLFYWDDFELVFGLTGQQPVGLGWFFTWQNEHLVALVRFAFFVVWHTTGDTRVMMLLVCAGFFTATVLLIETARSARGRAVWTDAAIPLLLLNWGHYQNLIFPLQFFFAWSVALACACLWAFVRAREALRWPELAVLLVAAPLLPLNGVFGALFAIPFVVLAIRAALERLLARDELSRRDSSVLAAVAAATIGTLILNFSGYRPVAHHPRAESLYDVFSSVTEVLAVGFGPAGIPTWPVSGIFAGALAALALGALAVGPRNSAPARRFSEALAASLIGFGALVGAIGFGRAGLGPSACFASRYSIFSAALIGLALIVVSVRWSNRTVRAAAAVIFAIAIAAQPLAFMAGREYGRDMARVSDKILGDLASGVPIEVVAHREGTTIYPSGDALTLFFRALSESGQGTVGRRTVGQPPCDNEVSIAPRIEQTNSMSWSGSSADCIGEDPFTVFALHAPVKVCAVRVRFRMTEPDGSASPAMMQAFWAEKARNSFDPAIRNQTIALPAGTTGERTEVFWVGDTIDRFRIDPNTRSCRFELLELTLITQ